MRMDSYGPSILATTILFLILGVLVVSLRYYTRVVIRNTIGHDDFLILLSLVRNFVKDLLSAILT